jgi:hypothetical protein
MATKDIGSTKRPGKREMAYWSGKKVSIKVSKLKRPVGKNSSKNGF